MDKPGYSARENTISGAVYCCCLGFFVTPYFVVMMVSAQRMKKLMGTAWAYVAGIMGITAMALSPCCPSTLLVGIFGILALVAINRREVQDYLQSGAEGRTEAGNRSYD